MRLPRVDHNHRFMERLKLRIIKLATKAEPPDVVKMLLYRPKILGGQLMPSTQTVMRGPSQWSVGEREVFAAFVSRLNQCPF